MAGRLQLLQGQPPSSHLARACPSLVLHPMQTPPSLSRLPGLLQALLLGTALLAAPAFAAKEAPEPSAQTSQKAAKAKPDAKKPDAKAAAKKPAGKKTAKKSPEELKPGPLADFGEAQASPEAVHVANWVSYTRDNKKKAFVVIDKKAARMYVFDPKGKLKSDTPVLLGKAVGDHSAPGIGNKPLSQIKEHEKTTPAGRFLAQPGRNNHGEDIIWIDYDASVSMHRLRKVGKEQRAERMATPGIEDNRISNGCVNVPPKFYNSVLRPTVGKHGAFVYVLPETRSPDQQFGSYAVDTKAAKPVQVAQGRAGK